MIKIIKYIKDFYVSKKIVILKENFLNFSCMVALHGGVYQELLLNI